jgi:hypothetical protein
MPEYIVEHHLQSDGGKILGTYPTGPWPSPVLGDLQRLAQSGLRAYWKPEAGKLVKRLKLSKPVPDLIVVRDMAGEEMFRWSCDQERDATGCS